MTGGEIIAIVVLTILIGSLFFFGFRRRGPWGSLWTFLLILFLGLFVANIWVTPIGPVWWGAAWVDLLFVGILFALLLASATPPVPRDSTVDFKETGEIEPARRNTLAVVGSVFWLMVVFFVAVIILGMVY